MRISPPLNRLTRLALYAETKINNRPFVFLIHPNEFIDEEPEVESIERRASDILSYYFKDILRHKLKTKNLGSKVIHLMEKEVTFFKKHDFRFTTCKEYYNKLVN